MEPYYSDEWVTLYHGDACDVLDYGAPSTGMVSGERPFDLTLTDPPYNYGLDYGTGVNDSLPRSDYIDWCHRWWIECRRLSKAVVVFPGNGNLDVWWQVSRPSAVGCWYKPGNSRSSIIGWEDWEPWLYWGGDKALVGGSSVVKALTGKWPETGNHPCPKPLSLMRGMLSKFGRAQHVLDPFAGSGTTLVAAKSMGRRATGIEINEAYCEIAARRLSQEVLAFSSGDEL